MYDQKSECAFPISVEVCTELFGDFLTNIGTFTTLGSESGQLNNAR
jgi:hypothetical protein